jgi:hypothetical protein
MTDVSSTADAPAETKPEDTKKRRGSIAKISSSIQNIISGFIGFVDLYCYMPDQRELITFE